jgi:VWFA-related protein
VALSRGLTLLGTALLAIAALGEKTAEVTTFSARVNTVPVPVVVRDRNANAMGTLTKEDFEVFDNGKRQTIDGFSVERSSPTTGAAAPSFTTPSAASTERAPSVSAGLVLPDRFVAFIFDDLHLNFGDLAQARKAVLPYFSSEKSPTTRFALFTTSGLGNVDFTNDMAKLRDSLDKVLPREHKTGSNSSSCPPYLSPYVADQIVNRDNPDAIAAILTEEANCFPGAKVSRERVIGYAHEALTLSEDDTRVAIGVLRSIVRRMSIMPGQREAVLVSPGFLSTSFTLEVTEVINKAARENVVVNAIDARGLQADPMYDASRPSYPPSVALVMSGLDRDAQWASGDVLAEVAEGTGGSWFHDRNDLGEGFRRAALAPDVHYVLTYSPSDLKNDGKFHKIKVALKEPKGYTVLARRGYYAPARPTDDVTRIKQDIDDAVFSRDEVHTIPMTLTTQFSKVANASVKLAVITHVDVAPLHFRKAEKLNSDEVVIVSALFDTNGNYVNSNQKTLQLRVKDEHLDERLKAGVTVQTDYDVKPGAYLVRLVVRDTEGQEIASTNGSVEIP